ncbi:MAG: monovalent cation/H+ antiporter subunit D family protein [Planctomycetota bacterium]|nr:MAG: monovalent cation/H+ antiporter subunit D family protein [Planctomycetota bacterium]
MTVETAVGLAVLLPLIGAAVVSRLGKVPNVRELASLLTAGGLFALVVTTILPVVRDGGRPRIELMEVFPGVPLAFEVEPLGMLFGLVASGLWIVTTIYAIGYMRGHDEVHQTRFFVCFALAIFGAMGVAFAANLFTLFLFYEAITLSTYPLVTHAGTDEAKRAGRIYLGVLMGTSVAFLLLAVLWTYYLTGTTEFRPGGILAGKAEGGTLVVLVALYAFGTGKAALMPFHKWLPAAMVAPTPVSALLHAVAVVKAGVFTVMKVFVYVLGLDLLRTSDASRWLTWVAAFTILTASIIALRKDNLKARLAYSTISQLAYIVLAAAIATPDSVIGGSMHIAMHAFGKITLFFCAGAIMVGAHKTKVSEMHGLGRRMPFTFLAFLLGSLSVIGVPPFGGSWSKWYMALGAAEAEQKFMIAVLMVSSLLSIGYLMPVVGRAFFSAPKPDPEHAGDADHATGARGIREAPLLCVAPPVFTALGCIALFFWPEGLYDLLAGMVGS